MKLITLFLMSGLLASSVFAADIKDYIDGPTGVTVKFNDNGSIKSIVASGEAELIFGDRKDERMAMQKATLRAKASISKFMSERLSSEEVMEELSKTVTEATVGGADPATSTANRQTLSTQSEVIKNSSDSILKGLITLGSEVNRDNKYVKVVLGTNEKLMKAADTLGTKMKQNLDDSAKKLGKSGNQVINESGTASSGREIRQSDALKDF